MADVTIPFTIPDALVPEMLDVFGEGYRETVTDPENPEETIANPQSQADYAKARFKEVGCKAWKNEVVRYRAKQASDALDKTFDITA